MKPKVHALMLLTCLVAGFFLLTFGCEKKMTDPKGTLEKQALQYWTERLINKNFEYTYEEEVEEGLPPFSTYKERITGVTRFPTSSVEIKDIEVEGDGGYVQLLVTCKVPGLPKEMPLPLGDRWIIKGNKWKHKLQEKLQEKKP
jgi:hypothetical protein